MGVARPDPSAHAEHYGRWLADGMHGEMGYLAREDARARRADLRHTFPEVRSVVVVAEAYGDRPEPTTSDDPAAGIVAGYARGADYHRVLQRKLRALLARLRRDAGAALDGRIYVDTGPVLERELAQRAGLGWFGRNTMLIHPRRGSYLFLGSLLLDAELEPDDPFVADRCGSCRACLDACPTGALLGRDERGAPVMDARRCISYLTIEQRGPIPRELRPLIGNRIYGCDICQEVCPFNRRFGPERPEPRYAARGPGERPPGVEALPGEERAAADVSAEAAGRTHAHPGTRNPSLVALLETALDEEAWEAYSRGSPMRRAGRSGFARNVCVGLGNWGSAEAVPVLARALSDPDPLVRGHAAWALGETGTGPAREALRGRAGTEGDPSVQEEIRRALETAGTAS